MACANSNKELSSVKKLSKGNNSKDLKSPKKPPSPNEYNEKLKILVVTDSRGRGLRHYLDETNLSTQCEYNIITIGGANLQNLLNIVDVESNTYDYFIVCGGICNLTSKIRSGNLICLHYERDYNYVDSLIGTIEHYKAIYGNRINIATIPPASLINYNSWKNGVNRELEYEYEYQAQQEQLLEHLEYINQTIVRLNIITDTETLNWAEKAFSSSIKRNGRRTNKFKASWFSDGVHPDPPLQRILFRRILEISRKGIDIFRETLADVLAEASDPDSDHEEEAQTSSAEESTDDSWNYKRRRH